MCVCVCVCVCVYSGKYTKAETQLHALERAAGGIGLHVNADKTTVDPFTWTRKKSDDVVEPIYNSSVPR